MNTTPKGCCESCAKTCLWSPQNPVPRYCPCHSNSTQEKCGECEEDVVCIVHDGGYPAPQHTSFSDFFHKASEEKEETMLKVAVDATNDQREQIGLPPLHTSPEKDHSHIHCWNQSGYTRPCGIALEKHEQCCLCDLKRVSLAKEPSFVDKTLEEFRDRFGRGNNWTITLNWNDGQTPLVWGSSVLDIKKDLEQWLSTKLEEAQKEHDECAAELVDLADERFKEGKNSERTRILTLLESRKDWVVAENPEDDRAAKSVNYYINAALTSLAAELQQESAP